MLNIYNNNYKNPELLQILENKRVILVGPSKSLLHLKNGEFIDSFDVVIRINRGIEPVEKYGEFIGYRTDILYNCLLEHPDNGGVIDIDFLKNNNIKFVCYHPQVTFNGVAYNRAPFHVSPLTLTKLKSNFKTHMIDFRFYNEITEIVKCRPNTGNIAIYDILLHNVKELYITGFTFYLDGFMSGYKEQTDSKFITNCFNSKRHDQKQQWSFLKKMKEHDLRIKTDDVLTNILQMDELMK